MTTKTAAANAEPSGPRGFAVVIQEVNDGQLHAELGRFIMGIQDQVGLPADPFSRSQSDLSIKPLSVPVPDREETLRLAGLKTQETGKTRKRVVPCPGCGTTSCPSARVIEEPA